MTEANAVGDYMCLLVMSLNQATSQEIGDLFPI